MTAPRDSRLTGVDEDVQTAGRVPKTAQTESPAYRLAFADPDFLRRDELRPVRLQLELLKPTMLLEERRVRSTVIMFGGARVPAPGATPEASTEIARRNLAATARYYDEARRFARLASLESMRHGGEEFVIATGGGPGVMEAGNLGAHEVGAQSLGLNIVLPHEQAPNGYVTPELCFNFHYFAIRKMHFLMRGKAAAIFPGGFGTLDEMFEVLTLVQTHKMDPMPIVLFGEDFWRSIINFEALRDAGTISPEDLELFSFVETAEAAWDAVRSNYDLAPLSDPDAGPRAEETAAAE